MFKLHIMKAHDGRLWQNLKLWFSCGFSTDGTNLSRVRLLSRLLFTTLLLVPFMVHAQLSADQDRPTESITRAMQGHQGARGSFPGALAFYYAAEPAWAELQAFDTVVVDPDHVGESLPVLPKTVLAAYVSVGEVQPSRNYAQNLPAAWLLADNKAWGSHIIDQSQAAWPEFFVNQVITPLWAKGFRSFFLDTLDSWQLIARTPETAEAQRAGLVRLIRLIKQRYPEARLIFNRGFEILPEVHDLASAVAAESLYQSYDAASKTYHAVTAKNRDWLMAQLQRIRNEFALPVIAIDYVPAAERELARATAQRIEADGFIPWVATGELDTLGVGAIEVMPRRVLIVHGALANERDLRFTGAVRLATPPLQYLGYAVDYADVRQLPSRLIPGQYAGLVVWLEGELTAEDHRSLARWLEKQMDNGIPLAVVGQAAPLLDTGLAKKLGLHREFLPATTALSKVEVLQRDTMFNFEHAIDPNPHDFYALKVDKAQALLTLAMAGQQQQAAALTPWGGYVVAPYAITMLANDEDVRWLVDPYAFFKAALHLPDMPIADVTTETGRRMLLVHMDGDGFVSRTELPGNPYAGEVIRDRIVKKYALPMSLSVIEAELSAQGLYPQLSARMEAVAREIFRAPHVEIASHSYSHPFNWLAAKAQANAANDSGEAGYSLNVPGYRFNLEREIAGSIDYINQRLAPPGKQVKLFLWTGDCIPGRDALELTERLGVLNMNGGDTVVTRSRNSLTEIEGLGMSRAGLFQVFAPNQNENVYTNNWTGPFYGYERVIETFQLTEKPHRLKPINIYFHTYLTTKPAGMQALDKVFRYASSQESTPVFASEYVQKVNAFQHLVVARTHDGWRIRGQQSLQTLRLPDLLGNPDLARSQGLAGYRDENGFSYVHLTANQSDVELIATADPKQNTVRLVSANARILEAQTGSASQQQWTLEGHVPLEFTLAYARGCRVRVAGRELQAVRREGVLSHYKISAHAARPLETICAH